MNWLDDNGGELTHRGVFRLQWVTAALKDVETASVKHGGSLPMKHAVVSSLLRGLEQASPHVVLSSCHVLVLACTCQDWLSSSLLLPELVARASTSPCSPILLDAVTSILLHDISNETQVTYSIRFNEHPFVSVLQSRPDAGPCLVQQLLNILTTHKLSRSSVDLVAPVIKYMLLHPAPPPYISPLVAQLYSSLGLLLSQHPDAPPFLLTLLAQVLPFQAITGMDQLLFTCSCACTLSRFHSRLPASSQQMLVTDMLMLCVEVTGQSLPVQPLLDVVEVIVQDCSTSIWQPHHYVAIGWLLLQHFMTPSITHQLLQLGRGLLSSNAPGMARVSSCLILPLVQLLSLPPSSLRFLDHTHNSHNQSLARALLDQVQSSSQAGTTPSHAEATPFHVSNHLDSPPVTGSSPLFSSLTSSVQAYLSICTDASRTCSWLQQIAGERCVARANERCGHLALLVAGIAVSATDTANLLEEVLQAFTRLCQRDPAITPAVLHFLIYLLGSTQATPSKLALLYTLPSLPTHVLSLGGVVSTFDLLSRHLSLLPVAMRLMCKLWLKQDRVYPYVRAMLTRPLPVSPAPPVSVAREIALAKVAITRDICCARAEQHGEEMLGFISKILSSNYQDAAVVAMALDGLLSLCLHEVVDVVTVWGVLGRGGRLASDNRPAVLVSLFPLLALAADVHSECSTSHKLFKEAALVSLWRGVFCKVTAVSTAALQALSNFKMDDFFLHHLPANVRQAMEGLSSDQSSDSGPVPLTGDVCVQLVHAVPDGTLSAYSSFLARLLWEELQSLPRGIMHAALRKAEMESVQETSLRATLARLKKEAYNNWNKSCKTTPTSREDTPPIKSSILTFFAKCEGLLPLSLPREAIIADSGKKDQQQGEVHRRGRGRREESVGVERDMAVLKNIVECADDLLVDLDSVPLWQGVVCINSTHFWECVQHICRKLYEVRLGAVGFREDPSPAQVQQAHSWALTRILGTLEECVRRSGTSSIGAFFAAMEVMSFRPPHSVVSSSLSSLLPATESLLLDLAHCCQGQLVGRGCVQSYAHPLVKLIMESEHAQLDQAVIVALPLLFSAASSLWRGQVPINILEKLVELLNNLLDYFNSSPNWYTSVILSKLLVDSIPRYHQFLQPLVDRVLPFLEEASSTSSLQLLSLVAPLLESLVVHVPTRQDSSLIPRLYAALQEHLAHLNSDLLSSPVGELCTFHFSSGTCAMVVAGLLTDDQTMAAISLLVSIVTVTSSPSSYFSLGRTLHSLCAHGHRRAYTLTEDVAAKWLSQLSEDQDQEVLEAVLVGLVGVVGNGMQKVAVSTADHVKLVQNLAYLLVEAAGKLVGGRGEYISGLAAWVRLQTALGAVMLLDKRERVPVNLAYLPPTSCLRSSYHLISSLVESEGEGLTEARRRTLVTCLISAMANSGRAPHPEQPHPPAEQLHPHNKQLLPPADYSSLLLPVVHGHHDSPDLLMASLQVLCCSRGGQGAKALTVFLTFSATFPFLADPVQLFILENLSFFLNCLTDGDRYQTFLQEVVAMVTRDCLSCVSLTRAVVKGLTEVVCGQEEVAQGSVQVTVAAATQLCVGLSAALGGLLLGGVMSELRQVLTYLMDAAVWDGLAAILASSAMEVGECGQLPCVQHALLCAMIKSSLKPFSAIKTMMEWVLHHIDADEAEVAINLQLLLHTLSVSCSPSCAKSSQHHIEVINILNVWISKNAKEAVSEVQWKLLLLLIISGCGLPLPSCMDVSHAPSDQVEVLLQCMQLSSATGPRTTTGKEKLCHILVECLVAVAGGDLAQVKCHFIRTLSGLVSSEQYRKGIVWTTLANLL